MKDVYSLFVTNSPFVSNYHINSSTSTIIYSIYRHHHTNLTTVKRKRIFRSSSQHLLSSSSSSSSSSLSSSLAVASSSSAAASSTITTAATTVPVTFASRSFSTGGGRLFIDDSPISTTYSARTGLKTAAALGGMLILVIFYLLWKQRGKCRPGESQEKKFDLDYWLKQVDLMQQKETQNYTKDIFLQLPTDEPRDTHEATASWILDTYKQWRLTQYHRYNSLTTRSIREPLTLPMTSSPKRLKKFLKRRQSQHSTIFRRIRNILTRSKTLGGNRTHGTLLPLIKIDTSRLDTELNICTSKQKQRQQTQNHLTPSISFYDEHAARMNEDAPTSIRTKNILALNMYYNHHHRANSWPKLRPNHSNTVARAQRIRKRLLNKSPSTSSLTSVPQQSTQQTNTVLCLALINRPKETVL
ncbi:unnamed protein product [Didymodactylos carnosus]|uniref:Uncharacterized protein n=1 Tax=Didymodactylos carnosus TaxID=1234261 RepID=A0A813V6B7_9BILA|nr:unnamed protein product [Didymodactylos carnosus]CAF0982217.1 unnamed protein product [Didymodactylos carnosus]CAF3624566.1 unnamed protein product [Didymodactylos carnosus]CAF3752764.1 unnamed protein product [Didymodactylos carnosus]